MLSKQSFSVSHVTSVASVRSNVGSKSRSGRKDSRRSGKARKQPSASMSMLKYSRNRPALERSRSAIRPARTSFDVPSSTGPVCGMSSAIDSNCLNGAGGCRCSTAKFEKSRRTIW